MPRTTSSNALALFHPAIRAWFRDSVGKPSAPQVQGWPVIARGDHALIVAPTGSGKTLAAFLYGIDRLVRQGLNAPLPNAVHVLYVSPLKALANDVRINLQQPLDAVREHMQLGGDVMPDIRVAVRSGDTPARERRQMLRKAPHILVTTPESLHILLTTPQQRGLFSALSAVIVDEVHAMAGTKRGAHLALTLERLDAQVGQRVQRIGLSATVAPLQEAAHWLVGAEPTGAPRGVTVVSCDLRRPAELVVKSPVPDLGHVEGSVWPDVQRLVLGAIRDGRTTLVFVNNRGLAERMAAQLNALAHEALVYPYHGSLDRERRLALEQALKRGDVKALVTTSALELGIDVGSVDQVVQVQSPARVSSALQRLGRAGHRLSEISRAVFVPTHLSDALEMLAIVEAARAGEVESIDVPTNALDVLAQVLVAMVALEARSADDLYAAVRGAWNYRALPRAAFDEVLHMLAGKYPAEVAAELSARLLWDRATGVVSPLPGSRLAAVLNGGTIPDRGTYKAVLAEGGVLGELDEEFVFESRVGDAFRLGASTFRIAAIEHARVIVNPAPGAAARLPFWHGEYGGRPATLAARIGALTRELGEAQSDAARDALAARLGADRGLVDALHHWIVRQQAVTGTAPDDRTLVLEQHRDETGALRLVLHAPFGVRVTAPWAMALAQRLRERLGADVVPMAINEGLMLRLPDLRGDAPAASVATMAADEAERRVTDAVGASSLFGARFRMNAARALVLPRSTPGRRLPLWMQRLKAQDLLEAVRGEPSFPLLVETYRDVLQDAFDLPALRGILGDLASGARHITVRVLEQPSPFARAYAFQFVQDWMYGDDAPRRTTGSGDALGLDHALLGELLGKPASDDGLRAALDAVLAARRGTSPKRQARSADDMAVLVARAGDCTAEELEARLVPLPERHGDPVAELVASGRAVWLALDGVQQPQRLVLADDHARYADAFAPADATSVTERVRPRHVAQAEVLVRWLAMAGPVSVDDVVARYPVEPHAVEALLRQRETSGAMVRLVVPPDRDVPRWCARRPLEAAWRRALGRLRQEVQPVDLPAYAAMLPRWHGIGREASATRARDVLAQLDGCPRPAGAWLADVLPARLGPGAAMALTHALNAGHVVWVGAPRAFNADAPAPLAMEDVRVVARGHAGVWTAEPSPEAAPLGSDERTLCDVLRAQGASFADDLLRATGWPADRVQAALAHLAARGFVTSDSADGLSAVSAWRDAGRPVRPRGGSTSTRRWQRPDRLGAGWSGRWSLAHTAAVLGPTRGVHDIAEEAARALLARYGVVSREWWRRDRPAVPWRDGARALVRLAFRGDAIRGWFVRGLHPTQFAHPAAADALRAAPDGVLRVLAAADPANVRVLALDAATWALHERPRGAGAALALRDGVVLASIEADGARLRVNPSALLADVGEAGGALARWCAQRLARRGRSRDLVLERVDDLPPREHPAYEALARNGWRAAGRTMRWPAPVGSA
jgi:ATP-dependent helicase Lhr and Lhr-like helicase